MAITTVATGNTSALGSDHGGSPGGMTEMAGSTWNTFVAKIMTRTIATTYSGSAVIAKEDMETVLSSQPSRRAAASIPSTSEMTVPNTPARTTRPAGVRVPRKEPGGGEDNDRDQKQRQHTQRRTPHHHVADGMVTLRPGQLARRANGRA